MKLKNAVARVVLCLTFGLSFGAAFAGDSLGSDVCHVSSYCVASEKVKEVLSENLDSQKGLEEGLEDYHRFHYLPMTVKPSALKDVELVFDPLEKVFKWKRFDMFDNAGWRTVNFFDVDPTLREVKTAEEMELIASGENTYLKMRMIGDDVGVDLGVKLPGGGPLTAIACGIICKIINSAGCGAGAVVVSTLNVGLGVLYAAVCSALDGGAVAGCVSTCLALPTP